MFDLHVVLGGEGRACYVRTWVHSDSEQPARLETGDDDGSKVWLNGKLLFEDATGGVASPGEHKMPVTLGKGWNALVLKIAQITGPWQFCLRIARPDGRSIEGLRFSPQPPDDAGPPPPLSPSPPRKLAVISVPPADGNEAGFVSLFNGRDLTGWDGKPGWWSVEDGTLTAQSTPQKKCTKCNYLIWKGGKPGDFDLRLSYKLVGGNSGIQVRSLRRPDWDTFGYQADMDGETWTGCLFEHTRGKVAGRGTRTVIDEAGKKTIAPIGDPAKLVAAVKADDWNDYRIIAKGPEITLMINGVVMCQAVDNEKGKAARSGIIALQMHPGPPMKIQFKNIRIKQFK